MADQKPPLSPSSAPSRRRPRCAICGKEARRAIHFDALRPEVGARIAADHPGLAPSDQICASHVSDYRTRYVAELLARERGELSELDRQVVASMAREETIARDVDAAWTGHRTFGERIADVVADFGGSWTFIGFFFAVLAVWMGFNIWAASRAAFDPYPFILLNLVLSCLAAIQAPIIMMSQKRQETKDRLRAKNDYLVNLKAELENPPSARKGRSSDQPAVGTAGGDSADQARDYGGHDTSQALSVRRACGLTGASTPDQFARVCDRDGASRSAPFTNGLDSSGITGGIKYTRLVIRRLVAAHQSG